MITLSRLYIHPVKSMRGLQLSHSYVNLSGLAFDRNFMLTTPDGTFLTARQYPQLVLFTPTLIPEGLHITAPDGKNMAICFSDFINTPQPTEVWGNHFTAFIAPKEINCWLSGYLNIEVQLRWVGFTPKRRVKRYPEIPLTFADGYPFLLLNNASLNNLQQRCPSGIKLEQFRPNIVVSGAQPWAEDSWQTVRIGEIIFDIVKPCSRCILTTVSTTHGHKHPDAEPFKTLQTFRSTQNGNVDFGQNMIARNSGILRIGDPVEVLATKSPQSYFCGENKSLAPSQEAIIKNHITIEYQGKKFIGNNHQILLEQLEQHGFRIPYSCRAGICGSCRLSLLKGNVTPLKQGALAEDGTLLSCSCIPKSNISLA